MAPLLKPLCVLVLLGTVLTACVAVGSQQNPSPKQITVFDGTATQTLNPADPSYTTIVRELSCLIANIDRPLYAYYPPERFQTEIAAGPHLQATYDTDVVLKGKGHEMTAVRLTVTVRDEMLILTQASSSTNWDASQASDTTCLTSLLEAVSRWSGVQLRMTAP